MPVTVTAIVPTYNRELYLSEAVVAILAQTRPVSQLIIWDDGSSDATPEKVNALQAAYPGRIEAFRSDNGGKSKALNAALQQARGDLIWICDDDDIALPHAVETLAGRLDADSTLGMVAGRHARFGADQPEDSGPGYWPDLSHGSVLRHLLEDIFFFQNATLVRRAVLDRAGPFNEALARSIDYDMFVRLAVRTPAAVIEETVFRQRKHDGIRGNAAALHAADRSDEVWCSADRAIFDAFRGWIPLTAYEAFFDTEDAAARRRAGLLQRGCVYARRTDWDAAIADFDAAIAALPDRPLAAAEAEVLRRAMSGKHGVQGLLRDGIAPRLLRLAGNGPAGRDVLRGLGRGGVWRLRAALQAGNRREAWQIGSFVARAMGRRPATGTAPVLDERDILPAEAFTWA